MLKPMGVFGGTFDPIHYGHLRSAYELLQILDLDEIRFVPCGLPPHRSRPFASAHLRAKLVELAIQGQSGFSVDTRELERQGPSYSVDTLESLRADYPSTPLCLIIGMDAFLSLPRWHEWQKILQLAHLVVAHRPGWRAPDAGPLGILLRERGSGDHKDLHSTLAGRIYIHAVTQLEISSTEIRDLIAFGRDPRFLLPDAVRDFIEQNACYRARP